MGIHSAGFSEPDSGQSARARKLVETLARETQNEDADGIARVLEQLGPFDFAGAAIEDALSDIQQELVPALLLAFIQAGNGEGIEYILQRGLVQGRADAQMLMDMLRAADPPRPDLISGVMRFFTDHPEDLEEDLSFTDDPLSPAHMRTVWAHELCDGGRHVRLTEYLGLDTDILVPHRIGSRAVVEIDREALSAFAPGLDARQRAARKQIVSVELPGSIRTVPQRLLSGGRNTIRHIILHDGTRSIEQYAFSHLRVPEISLPDSVEHMGEGAFSACAQLERAYLGQGLRQLPVKAFENCKSLTQQPDISGLLSIGDMAFAGTGVRYAVLLADGPELGRGVFAWCRQLQQAEIEDGVCSVPEECFVGCHALKQAQFPKSLLRIGQAAFRACGGLREISLPDGLEEISDSAFRDCWGLTDAKLPARLLRIGDNAFSGCSNLRTAQIPACSDVGHGVFSGCSFLRTVAIADGAASVPAETFSKCISLQGIEIPVSVREIGEGAFEESGLESIRIPSSVRYIGMSAFRASALRSAFMDGTPHFAPRTFEECAKLTRVGLSAELAAIAPEMFEGCTALTAIVLPARLQKIGLGAFAGSGLESVRIPGTVRKIGEGAFSFCKSMEEVEFADGGVLRTIGAGAFEGCSRLREVRIPEGVTHIRDSAFAWSGIERIVLPASLRSIGPHAFFGCRNLQEVVFRGGAGVSDLEIGPYAFFECISLASVELPQRLTYIGRSAFAESGLEHITIPPHINFIGAGAFRDADSLRSARIEASGRDVIPDDAFRRCSELREVDFQGRVERIGSHAFSATGLDDMQIPASVREISHSAFRGSTVRRVHITGTVRLGANVFRECRYLREVHLPESMQEIPPRTFRNCTRLKHIVFPPHLRTIGAHAFHGDPLREAFLPDSVECIGDGAFCACSKLTSVRVPARAFVAANAFARCDALHHSGQEQKEA